MQNIQTLLIRLPQFFSNDNRDTRKEVVVETVVIQDENQQRLIEDLKQQIESFKANEKVLNR